MRQCREVVEIWQPAETVAPRRFDESRCAADDFLCTADQDWARVAVRGPGEIQVGLDRAKVIDNVGPRPAGYPEAVEVALQTPAEVSAVDSAGAANRGTTHDRHLASRPVGELGLVALHQRAGRADRQPQSVGGLGAQRRIAQAESGLEHCHQTARVSRKPVCDNRSSASGADDQHIAVQSRCSQGSDSNLRLEWTEVALPQHAVPKSQAVGQVVDPLEQQVGQQPDRLGIVVGGLPATGPVHHPVHDGSDQDNSAARAEQDGRQQATGQ